MRISKMLINGEKIHQRTRFKSWSLQEKIIFTVITVIFTIYAVSLMFPLYFTLINSLKSFNDYMGTTEYNGFGKNLYGLPRFWEFPNYIQALQLEASGTKLWGMFINSIWLSSYGTILSMLASIFMAYALSKYRFFGSKFLYSFGIIVQIIPIVGSTAAAYRLLYNWDIANNPVLIGIIFFAGYDFTFIILYGFFKSVSWNYAEAAFMDGASNYTVLFKVMLPQALPPIAALTITSFIGRWNDYLTPFLYMPDYPTISLGIYLLDANSTIGGGLMVFFAAVIISIIPVVLLFIAFQNIIMQNVVAGGLKG
ncbi:MAG: carbohydrate ABC transporter permease [Clostridia bacterium]|nr:carbohydrate ABC transporter permease [Clostridia bacterium]